MIAQVLTELRMLNLGPMAERLEQWLDDPANRGKSHAECLLALTHALNQANAAKRTQGLFRRAALPARMSTEDVWVGAGRGLSARMLADLKTADWIDRGQSVVITGESQVGKTYLAAALARESALARRSVDYCRTSELLEALLDKTDNRAERLVKRAQQARLLVLDDFAMTHAAPDECHALYQLLDGRQRAGKAVLVASPTAVDEWTDYFESPTIASAIFGRLLRRTEPIALQPVSGSGRRNR